MNELLRKSNELDRRRFISATAKTCLGVTLLPQAIRSDILAATKAPAHKPTARNVIFLYMSGGMSHIDTFDPKPDADPAVRGDVGAIPTKAEGVMVSEYFENLAREMDKVTLLRSVSSTQGAHEQGNYYMHTSYTMRGTIQHPGLGAWMLRHEGRTNRTLPGSVRIGGGAEGGGAGFMESKFAPLVIGSANEGLKNSRMPAGLTEAQFQDRLLLSEKFDTAFHERYNQKHVRAYNDMYDDAIRLMKSEDLKAFDLHSEPGNIREEYGQNGFGQGCLLARRLIEHDVRFVEVTLGGWDNHNNIYPGIAERCRELDQAMATLIRDLHRRGLLDETMVVLATEFGRTPELNINDGRDHYPQAFSCLVAGGGIPGGRAFGATDGNASMVTENKITVPDFNATIAYALGLPLEKVIYSPSKRPFTVADKGQPVLDLFA
jgi:hypothetical protein